MRLRFLLPLLLVAAVSSCADASPETTPAPGPSTDPPGPSIDPPGPSTDATDHEWALATKPDRPRVIAETTFQVHVLAIDESDIYWSTMEAGILRVRKTGGPVETFVDKERVGGLAQGLAVDDTAVYWTDLTGGTVSKRSKAGGPIEVLASEQINPWGLAIDATRVYWANNGDYTAGGKDVDGEIRAVDKKGGTAVTLLSAQQRPMAVAVDDDSVYYSSAGRTSDGGSGQVLRVPKAGGAPVRLASDTGSVNTLAARSGAAYFVISLIRPYPLGPAGPLVRAPGGVGPTILDPDGALGGGPGALALGEDSVFYANYNTQTRRAEIRRVAMDGSSSPRVIAQRQYPEGGATSGPEAMGIDADNIYWADFWWNYKPEYKGTIVAAPLKP